MTEPLFTLSESELRALATEMQQGGLSFDPVTMRKASITAVNLASSPPVVSIQLSGDTTTTIPDVRIHRNYVPLVGDTALVFKQGNELLAWGTVASSSYEKDYARYARTSTQNISNTVTTKGIFNVAEVTDSTTVTVSTDRDFTLVRGALYSITATIPWQGSNLGARWAWLGLTSDSATRYAVSTLNPNNASFPIHNFSVTRRFAAGTVLSVYVFQDTGATLALGPGSGIAPMDLNIAYLKP